MPVTKMCSCKKTAFRNKDAEKATKQLSKKKYLCLCSYSQLVSNKVKLHYHWVMNDYSLSLVGLCQSTILVEIISHN